MVTPLWHLVDSLGEKVKFGENKNESQTVGGGVEELEPPIYLINLRPSKSNRRDLSIS